MKLDKLIEKLNYWITTVEGVTETLQVVRCADLDFLLKMLYEPKCYWTPQDEAKIESLREAFKL